ncbi:MEDS domain-containing protein [Spirillospora sp. CA-255316]
MAFSGVGEAVGRMELGDHLCLPYAHADERRAVLLAYVRGGLAAGHKIVYVAEQDSHDVLPPCLRPVPARLEPFADAEPPRPAALDPGRALESGRLVVRTVAEVAKATGGYDPDELMGLIATEIELALVQGYRGVRLTGERPLTWPGRLDADTAAGAAAPGEAGGAGDGAGGGAGRAAADAETLADEEAAERFAACERRIAEVFRTTRPQAMILCQYDRGRFDAVRLEELESWHRARVRADDLYDDGRLRAAPLFGPPGLALSGRLDAATRPALDRVLALLPPGAGLVCLEMSGVAACDEEGLRRAVEAGRTSGGRQRQLLLRGVSPRLAGMLRDTGLERAPGVTIEEHAR